MSTHKHQPATIRLSVTGDDVDLLVRARVRRVLEARECRARLDKMLPTDGNYVFWQRLADEAEADADRLAVLAHNIFEAHLDASLSTLSLL